MAESKERVIRIDHPLDMEFLDSIIGTISNSYQSDKNDNTDKKYEGFKRNIRSQLLQSDEESATTYRYSRNRSADFVIRDGELIEYHGHKAKVVIPDDVIVIGERAFYQKSDLVEITMNSSVKMISDSAFCGCVSLQKVQLSDDIIFLGIRAFSDCTALTEITLPKELMYAGKLVFSGCQNLQYLTINNKLKIIEEGSFLYCARLKSITISESVTYIAPCSFAFCLGLEKVELSNTVERIGACSFLGCKLSQIVIPSSVNIINDFAFGCFAEGNAYYLYSGFQIIGKDSDVAKQYASEYGFMYSDGDFLIEDGVLKKYTGSESVVEIPDGVSVIGELAFDGNKTLQRVVIPNSVTKIEDCAFRESGLTSFTIGKSIESIGSAAFDSCDKLKNVFLNTNALQTIKEDAFAGCAEIEEFRLPRNLTNLSSSSVSVRDLIVWDSKLDRIEVDSRNPSFCSIDGVLFSKDLKTLVRYPDGRTETKYTVPDHVERIGENAFAMSIHLESVIIPKTVKKIEYGAFFKCISLKEVKIRYGVCDIGDCAFEDCFSLSVVTIPGSVKRIGPYAFDNCRDLKGVIFYHGIEEIEYGAFEDCKNLKSVTIPSSVKTIGDLAFGTFTGDDDKLYYLPGFTVCGYIGSAAQEYASENEICFITLRTK